MAPLLGCNPITSKELVLCVGKWDLAVLNRVISNRWRGFAVYHLLLQEEDPDFSENYSTGRFCGRLLVSKWAEGRRRREPSSKQFTGKTLVLFLSFPAF